MITRWRIAAYAVDQHEPDHGPWRDTAAETLVDADGFVEEAYDWVYLERQEGDAEPVRVAFDGIASGLPELRPYIEAGTA